MKTEEDRRDMGCFFMCVLIDFGAYNYYNNSLHLNKAVKSESQRNGISECFEDKAFNSTDCTPFYKIWECFEICFKHTKEAVFDALDAKELCRKEFGAHEVASNYTFITHEEKEHFGCFVRCVNIKMEVLKNNKFNPDKLITKFRHELRSMIIRRMKKCHVQTNSRFKEIPKYSCLYFYYYNECNEKDLA